MTGKNKRYKLYIATLLLCFLQVAGIDVYAQEPVQTAPQDSTRTAPKARARRTRPVTEISPDTLATQIQEIVQDSSLHATLPLELDSLAPAAINTVLADSLEKVNKANMEKLQKSAEAVVPPTTTPVDSVKPEVPAKRFLPNPNKATWLAVVFPGGGQIYNRKYWKLPIVYGGLVGCAYALTWNNKMYKDYSKAYTDIMSDNPNATSYNDFLPAGYKIPESQMNYYKEVFRKRKDMYRRYRDMSIFAVIGVYLLSIVDAYVDAELSDFDITPDLSMRVEPTMMNTQYSNSTNKAVGVQCSFRF